MLPTMSWDRIAGALETASRADAIRQQTKGDRRWQESARDVEEGGEVSGFILFRALAEGMAEWSRSRPVSPTPCDGGELAWPTKGDPRWHRSGRDVEEGGRISGFTLCRPPAEGGAAWSRGRSVSSNRYSAMRSMSSRSAGGVFSMEAGFCARVGGKWHSGW